MRDWKALPQPRWEEITRVSPLAQSCGEKYQTPNFPMHGTSDDLIPWQQSQRTYSALVKHGAEARLALVEGAPHICGLSSNPESEGWKAALEGYDLINPHVLWMFCTSYTSCFLFSVSMDRPLSLIIAFQLDCLRL